MNRAVIKNLAIYGSVNENYDQYIVTISLLSVVAFIETSVLFE